MDVRIDPLAETLRCPHGREFVMSSDGDFVWLPTPCDACEVGTVALVRQRQPEVAA